MPGSSPSTSATTCSPVNPSARLCGTGGHFLFVCKTNSHPAIEEYHTGIPVDERIAKVRCGKKWTTYRYQWLQGLPLRGDATVMNVNWLMIDTKR